MTAGFTTVFVVFGLVVAPLASSAQRYLPWFSLAVGLALAGAGLSLVAGRSIAPRRGLGLADGRRSPLVGIDVLRHLLTRSPSLTCTIAPFLAVVVSAFRADSPLTGAGLFLLYAAGMGLVVGTAALAVASGRAGTRPRRPALGPGCSDSGRLSLALVGGYVATTAHGSPVLRGAPPRTR